MTSQKQYWDKAGDVGYQNAMFTSPRVGAHIMGRIWDKALDYAQRMGVTSGARVMDLGCGDGAFANRALAQHFLHIDGFDLSDHAIERAKASKKAAHVHFHCTDITTLDLPSLGRYDAVFMIGILHHVKSKAPDILRAIGQVTDRLIVLEPNGSHPARKLLEKTTSYKDAGEDSFRKRELEQMFAQAGYRQQAQCSINIFPNFTPRVAFEILRPMEPLIEWQPLLQGLCTSWMYALQK